MVASNLLVSKTGSKLAAGCAALMVHKPKSSKSPSQSWAQRK
jgi:hypothetical protein